MAPPSPVSQPVSAATDDSAARKPLRALACVVAALVWWLSCGPVHAAKPHQHGVAIADIAVDRGGISVRLDIPLDNLLGFERAPRTDAERNQAQVVLKQLNDVATLVRIDAAAGCSVSRVALVAPELGVPETVQDGRQHDNGHDHRHGARAGSKASGHADLVADYEFSCSDTSKASAITLGLFDAFPRLRRIEVQTATPRGQLKAVLVRPNGRVALAR